MQVRRDGAIRVVRADNIGFRHDRHAVAMLFVGETRRTRNLRLEYVSNL